MEQPGFQEKIKAQPPQGQPSENNTFKIKNKLLVKL